MYLQSSPRVCVMDKTCLSKYIQRITSSWTLWFVLLVMTVAQSSPALKASQEHVQCDCLQFGEDAASCVNGTETCPPPTTEEKRVHCYAAWKNFSGQVKVESMGCWLDHYDCYDRFTCEETDTVSGDDVYFCCCEGSFCNRNHKYRPQESTSISPLENATPGTAIVPPNPVLSTILYSIVPIVGIFVIVVATFYMWRKHKMAYHLAVPDLDPHLIMPESQGLAGGSPPMIDEERRPLQLESIIARGRYAHVWKAQMAASETTAATAVAIKIFPLQDQSSFRTENEIYRLPLINGHPNILHYVGAERRGEGMGTELWLITQYHGHGSLYDYLKGHTISWPELLRISRGMVSGLAFLHEALHTPKSATQKPAFKPAIAHRDFKSKNVLLKADMTACVADFGLAMKFEQGCMLGDDHGQVGTRRYMAPEVLEGAINFNRDAFLRIDMYACGLVLWELLSRCTGPTGLTDEYHMPFEEEAGLHPTLEDMQDVVIGKKLRPQIRQHWLQNEHLASLCNTIEECWDQDPEARLSSGCVEERISQLIVAHGNHCHNQPPTTMDTALVTPQHPPQLPQNHHCNHNGSQNPLVSSSSPTATTALLSPSAVVTMDTSLSTATTVETSSSELEDSGGSSSSSLSAGSVLAYMRTGGGAGGGETNAVYSPPNNQLSSTRI